MEKFITAKSAKLVTKEDNEWIELIDSEGKTHRIFPSMLGNDGVWVHLDKEVDILKGYIETGIIEGKAFKLTKEKKGNFYNVIAMEEVKGVFEKEAIKKVQDAQVDEKTKSIEKQVALKSACELAIGKIIDKDAILPYAQLFTDWLEGGMRVISPETHPQEMPEPAKVEALRQSTAVNVEDLKIRLKELYYATPKKVDGPQLAKWGIKSFTAMDTLPQEKLLEIAKEVEKIK